MFKVFTISQLKRPYLPSSPDSIALYMTHLHRLGLQSTTIRAHLSALSFFHRIKGYPSPTSAFLITKLLETYRRRDRPRRTRKPIHSYLLKRVNSALSRHQFGYDSYLYRAIFSLMYHGALRISEIAPTTTNSHALLLDQVHIKDEKHGRPASVKIIFRSFKHTPRATTTLKLKP